MVSVSILIQRKKSRVSGFHAWFLCYTRQGSEHRWCTSCLVCEIFEWLTRERVEGGICNTAHYIVSQNIISSEWGALNLCLLSSLAKAAIFESGGRDRLDVPSHFPTTTSILRTTPYTHHLSHARFPLRASTTRASQIRTPPHHQKLHQQPCRAPSPPSPAPASKPT